MSSGDTITNPGFEIDASDWVAENGASGVARVTSQFHTGVASLQITADGTDPLAGALSTFAEVTPGAGYTLGIWMRPDDSQSEFGELAAWFYDSSFVAITPIQTTGSIVINPGVWTFVELVGTAPSNAEYVRMAPYFRTSGANYTNTDIAGYIDDALLEDAGTTRMTVEYRDARI
jgi:hypothetical protein